MSGVVVDADGTPVSGVRVNRSEACCTTPTVTATTDQDGRFNLPVTRGGTYLEFQVPRTGLRISASFPVDDSGDPTSPVDLGVLRLPRTITKTVRVLDAAGNPLAGAVVTPSQGATLGYYMPDWLDSQVPLVGDIKVNDARQDYSATTNAAGEVQIEVLRVKDDPSFQTRSPSGLPILSIDFVDPATQVKLWTNTSHSTVTDNTHTVTLPGIARVSGVVVDADGTPVSGVRVVRFEQCCAAPTVRATTDQDGRFNLPVTRGGTYLEFQVPRTGLRISASFPVDDSGDPTSPVDLGVLRLPRVITKTVRVLDAAGNPVPGATVSPYLGRVGYYMPDWLDSQVPLVGDIKVNEVQQDYSATTNAAGEVQIEVLRMKDDPSPQTMSPSGLPPLGVSFVDPATQVRLLDGTADSTVTNNTHTVTIDGYVLPKRPDAPGSTSVERGDRAATVTWDPAAGNGATVTRYTVTSTPDARTCTATGATTCTVTGLTNGTAYRFSVVATNVMGDSPASTPSPEVTPAGVPGQVATPTATRGDQRATVTWATPSGNGTPVIGYTVTSTPEDKTCTTAGELTCTVTGLTNGTTYRFTVVATNAVGDSPTSPASPEVVPAGVPDQVATPTAVRGDRSATVTWDPAAGNGATVTRYTVTSTPDAQTCTTTGATTCTVTGLTNGTAYLFTVTATNAIGDSQTSPASPEVVPAGVPDQVATPTATRGDRQATVTWAAASGNGTLVTGYTVTSAPGAQTCTTTGATTCTITGLTNGTAYRFTVVATNTIGDSPASAPALEVTPAGLPDAPAAPVAARGDRSASVSWSAASGNGAPVTGYTVTSTPGAKSCTTSTTSCTVTGLTNGTAYRFTLTATNNVGDSPASDPSGVVTPAGVPDQAARPAATRGDHQATITWSAASGNGAPVTGYTVTSAPGAKSCTTTGATSCTVTGLANGTAYRFTVIATNTIGDSPSSDPSAEVIPAGVPDQVAIPTATRGDRSASVSWAATSGNGTPVTGYTVTSAPGAQTCTTTNATTCTITGLANGTAYLFTVTATNAIGDSQTSPASPEVVPAGVPDQVAQPTATRGDHQATITWTAASGNGTPVTGYTVTSTPGAKTCTTTGATTCTVTGLANGTAYRFTVVTTNAVGDSPNSDPTSEVTPAGVPDQAARPAATRGDHQATITWTATSGNGTPVTGYTVTSAPGAQTCTTTGATTCTITGLTNGTAYRFTVVATNTIGDSQPSPDSGEVTPAGLPDAPAAPAAVRGDRSATVTWAATPGNGALVTGYTVTSIPGAKTCTTTGATTCTVTGLANGTAYRFTVLATNAVGDSPASTPSDGVTPAGVPDQVATPTAAKGDRRASITWRAVSSNSSSVTGYRVVSSPGGRTCTTTGATTCTITGLTNGTVYRFTVTATNAIGTGAPSPLSNAVRPAGPPTRVTKPTGTVKGRAVTIRWKPAASNGAPVLRYVVDRVGGRDISVGATNRQATFRNLKRGVHRFRVIAYNTEGASTASATVVLRVR
ncbi:fibronectin type III domain-containing protein [Nocardioides litoris]|uniref:fibronectin type III domain-containing protein n=1 Tax=Nocardioides litoris TaxID=1926648 RepID=UPI0014776AB1|nr:fibronectin type III domain-containing protein [Nocardioides litoris]